METKNNVEFKRTPFYAENLGEGEFAAIIAPLRMRMWICSQCRKKEYTFSPKEKGCHISADGLHKWETVDFRSKLIKHLPIPKKWKKVIELLDINNDIVP